MKREASLQHWNTVVWLALAVAVIVGHEALWTSSHSRFVNGFVIVGQESRRHCSQRQRLIQDRQHPGVCFGVEQKEFSFSPLHAKAKQRYGFEVRRAKREANRQRRRDRAETMEASINEIGNGNSNDSDSNEGEETTNGRTSRVVAVLKWPLRRIRKLFR